MIPMILSGIDHVMVVVKDLDRARQAYERLGFTLSARGDHRPPLGTANHTIMARGDYLELLAVTQDTESNRVYREALADGEGIVALALATPDATQVHAAWKAAGMRPKDVVRISRPVTLGGGAPVEARFELTHLPEHALPGAEVFACCQRTREAVWLPDLLDHPNTTIAVRAVTIAAPDPRDAAEAWARALVGSSTTQVTGGFRIALGAHAIDLIDPRSAADRFDLARVRQSTRAVGITLLASDLSACRARLARAGVPFRDHDERLLVAPEHACGVAIAWSTRP